MLCTCTLTIDNSCRLRLADLARHTDMGNAIFVVDIGDRLETELLIKGLQMRLRTQVERVLRPVLQAGGHRA